MLVRLVGAVRRGPASGAGDAALLHLRTLMPWLLVADAIMLTFVAYLLLQASVGRPLMSAQRSLEHLERLDLNLPLPSEGGPLLARFQASLHRAAEALREQQALTRAQLQALQQTNQKLASAQTELVASERLATVGKLAAGVAHEVGNPLSGILGYLSLARARTEGDDKLRSYLDLVEQELQRINGIVRGLLELGRPSPQKLEPVDVERLAQTCAKLVRGGPDFTDVRVTLDVQPGLLARAEPGALSQVFINLLINGAQAMNGHGALTLRGMAEGGEAILCVEDSGPGIPQDVMPHLFEPFFTTKSAGKGTGLGLSVCDHLVRTMGGQLAADNRPEGGARFRFSLRLALT